MRREEDVKWMSGSVERKLKFEFIVKKRKRLKYNGRENE